MSEGNTTEAGRAYTEHDESLLAKALAAYADPIYEAFAETGECMEEAFVEGFKACARLASVTPEEVRAARVEFEENRSWHDEAEAQR